jgi:UrcA family protein
MRHHIAIRAEASRAKLALLLLAGALAAAMGVGTACAATSDGDVPTRVVRYSDQSLATDGGVQALYRRLVIASEQVCPEESSRDLGAHALVRHCREQALARAVRQINNSRLAALYAAISKNG